MLRPTLNLGILAHIDAGKTSLTERLLFDGGAIATLGSVDSGSTTTDSGALERQRGITIRSAVASFTAGDLQINLVDTPGHPDFIAEVERALSVLDGAILVISAVEGVQAQTRVIMRSLREMHIPTVLFVNKIDRMGARYEGVLAEIRDRLSAAILPMSHVVDGGTRDAAAAPRSLAEPGAALEAAEMLADQDDALLSALVEGQAPAGSAIEESLIRQVSAGLVHPVFFGSAMTGQGCAGLVAGLRRLLRPAEVAPSTEVNGTVFAIDRASNGEKVAYLRLFDGQLALRQTLTLWREEALKGRTEITGRITGLDVVGASPGGHLTAGNIGRIRGLGQVRVGDQVGAGKLLRTALFASPRLASVTRAQDPAQEGALRAALLALADEDPLIGTRAEADGATSVLLYGAVQREVIQARLAQDFGIETRFEPIATVYRERPAGRGEALTELDRLHGSRFWATIGLRVEPAELGAGIRYGRDVEWGSVPRAFHAATEETVRQSLQQGLCGWEITDCAITVTHFGYLQPMSTAADFRQLARLVVRRALERAGTRVYEPCERFDVEVPPGAVSPVLSRLAGLEAVIEETSDRGRSWLITGDIPARCMPDLVASLPGLTHGEGVAWSQPGPDRPVRGAAPHRQ